MGLYSRHVFPWLCDWVMQAPRLAILRRELLDEVRGDVLEIGFGTGRNLEHYPKHVARITAVDPGLGMARIARRRVGASRIRVEMVTGSAECLPFEDGRFDRVVSAWTLCSIADVARAVAEVHRVLRPGGRYLFLEHGLAEEPSVIKWQRRLNPIQRVVGDGCRLDLDVPSLITGQPFADIRVDRFVLDRVPRAFGTMYRGMAIR